MKITNDKELIQQAFRKLLKKIQEHSLGMYEHTPSMLWFINVVLDPESRKSVEEAMSAPWVNQSLSVSKHITKRSVHGISVEQTDLILSGELCSAHTKWRTICFESHSVHEIEEMLQSKVKGKKLEDHLREVPNSLVQGYPAFVMMVVDEVTNLLPAFLSEEQQSTE